MSEASTATFRIFRGEHGAGTMHDYTTEITTGMVVLEGLNFSFGLISILFTSD